MDDVPKVSFAHRGARVHSGLGEEGARRAPRLCGARRHPSRRSWSGYGESCNRPPPRHSRFGSPLDLSRVHWVRPELVAEVKFLTWTDDNLLRQVIYEGLREDRDPRHVRREVPSGPNSAGARSDP